MMTRDVKTPLEMFYHWEQTTPDKVYLRQAVDGGWEELTWADTADRVRRLASYLRSKPWPAGSRVSIWSANSKDWIISDLAIMLAGHVSVPLYPGQDPDSARYVLEHSDCQLILCGQFDQSASADAAIPSHIERVALHGCSIATTTSLAEICTNQARFEESPLPDLDALFTIIYTSGTTGRPKGVMHLHGTPGHVVPEMAENFSMNEPDSRLFSFLPLAHAAERIVVDMCSIYTGSSVSFSAGQETFAAEIREVQPTFFFAVPRLWIKFKEAIDAKVPAAVQAGFDDAKKLEIATMLGFGSARCILTGSAPCPRDVQQWFFDMNIILRDGYGMTENFIQGCAWLHTDAPILGSVGKPMTNGVEVRISDAGEIQFKSAGVMAGYYLNPEKTAEVLVDGWYCTGDSGRFDEDGNLYVTGRISEVFKTTKGKFIVPAKIEGLFARSPLLAQFCLFGHGRNQPLLMTTLSELGREQSAQQLKTELAALLDEINQELAGHERVEQIFVTPEWTIDNALLTPTLKIKCHQIEERFTTGIEAHLGSESVSLLD